MSVPRYQQIADELRSRITGGDYAVGDRLPSLLALQREFDVPGINTVRAALRVLAEHGLVRTDRGRGTFVVATQYPAADRDELLAALRQARETVDRAIGYLEHTAPATSSPKQHTEATAEQQTAPRARPASASTALQAEGGPVQCQDALLHKIIDATDATIPDPDLWPSTVEAIATRRNRAVTLSRTSPDRVEATFMRRGRSRDANYTVDSVNTYSPDNNALAAVQDIRRYLTGR